MEDTAKGEIKVPVQVEIKWLYLKTGNNQNSTNMERKEMQKSQARAEWQMFSLIPPQLIVQALVLR